ncbi:MAG TPA: CAP domain-containing protein [Pyrinomonadaceae bacterium]|jgi:hypothetical protein
MSTKFAAAVLAFAFVSIFYQNAFSQVSCDGKKLFTEKKCLGDDISPQEKELFRIVNEYRAANNLPLIPLSESLSRLANRHLLDLTINIKSFTHGWSNCPYDIKNENTWNCVTESPKRLNSGYTGEGFENLYRNDGGAATPALALQAWKKSDLHNSLILNLNVFKDKKFDAFGIAIDGEYVALWFGSAASNYGDAKNGLGASFEKYVTAMSGFVVIKKSSASSEAEFSGASADSSVKLSVSEANTSIRLKSDKNSSLNAKNRNILKIFMNNLASEWTGRESWIDSSLKKLQQNPKSAQTVNQGSKTFVINKDTDGYISISVKPYKKIIASQIK